MARGNTNGDAYKRRSYSAVLLALAAGLGVGAVAAWVWLWLAPPAVPLEDYAVLVSAAYDRERLPFNAVERLTAAGVRDVGSTVAAIAREYRRTHPERQRDAGKIEQLAEALQGQSGGGGSGMGDRGGGWSWAVVPLLLAAVAGLIAATRGRRLRRGRAAWRSLPEAVAPRLPKAELMGGLRSELPLDLDEGGAAPAAAAHARLPGTGTDPKASRLSTVTGKRRELVLRPFVCSYHAGEEPFEDVHPILHEDGDALIGACGLTAAAKHEACSPARYYAFTAWAHDYLSGEPMRAVGLLSPWASGRKRLAPYDPALTQASLHRTEKGLTATMETKNLFVTVEVADLGYGTARDVPANSYFTILSVKFSVTIKA